MWLIITIKPLFINGTAMRLEHENNVPPHGKIVFSNTVFARQPFGPLMIDYGRNFLKSQSKGFSPSRSLIIQDKCLINAIRSKPSPINGFRPSNFR